MQLCNCVKLEDCLLLLRKVNPDVVTSGFAEKFLVSCWLGFPLSQSSKKSEFSRIFGDRLAESKAGMK